MSDILNGCDLSQEFGKSLNEGAVVISCGAKKSGKSTFMLAILRAAVDAGSYDDYILVFPSLYVEQHDSYAWCMKRKEFTIYTNYHNFILEQLYARNMKIEKRKKTLVVIDDATTFAKELKLATNESLIALVSQARHLQVTLWLLLHSLKSIISPCLRENTNWLIIYSVTNAKLLKDIHEEFLSVQCDYNEFIQWYRNMSKEKFSSFLLKTLPPVAIDIHSNQWITVERFRKLNANIISNDAKKKTHVTTKSRASINTARPKPSVEALSDSML